LHLPRTHEQVHEATEAFLLHYHDERPNQARTSGNRPPRLACSQFPTLPVVPETVVTLRPLARVNQQAFARTIQATGKVTINHERYYVSRALTGQRVMCWVNAPQKQFDIWHRASRIKQISIKGLYGTSLPFEESLMGISQEARSEYRRSLQAHATYHQGHLWA
jgi:hypothetical protein